MGRFHCPGSNEMPLPATCHTYQGGCDAYTQVTPTYAIHHDDAYGVCGVCHEPRRLLKSGRLPKHSRWLSWREQEDAAARGVDLGEKLRR